MNDKEKEPVTIEMILDAVKSYSPKANLDLIRRAYELARKAHEGQTRVSGEAYIIHPLHVAQILTQLHLDDATISAALLHDVVEDTIYTNKQMKEMFGDEVAMLIDGVTKLGRLQYKSKEEAQLESYRKMFLAMAKDIRVIMIKLADRLHNMRTLKYMREDKQKRIARETIEIYAPLANRLGISSIKWELEDLCLRYLEPEIYYDLVENVKQKRKERQSFIDTSIEQIKEKLAEANIKADISGRAKHFYSIYKKMKRDNKDLSEIYDLSAVRVLVDSVKDCYGVLGVIHAMWKPIPGRFKDYIAMPKSNGYQSLHTTVMTRGYPLEIQIRTFAMHQVSEFGVAAHWKYKEAGKGAKATGAVDQKMSWLRQMVNLQQELSDPKEYFEALKVDVFSDEVFVFTPKGDVVDLPKGSIPIDFAYRIHTEVGHHCVGAKVNGKLVPLEYKLKNGDIVSVITNKANNGPSRDWLNI
ncbi:bifunctional (p)ppGpp synthetase/guanosine-3',5'-bis(diphosphate) 3'-pyrophosphohydrolase, partial [Mitsuokella jalaludinii]